MEPGAAGIGFRIADGGDFVTRPWMTFAPKFDSTDIFYYAYIVGKIY
jgi:hypothetical protein